MRIDFPVVGHVAIGRIEHFAAHVVLTLCVQAVLVATVRSMFVVVEMGRALCARNLRHRYSLTGYRIDRGQDFVRITQVAARIAE